jgi:tetratricopeptide (TPR) repeat protein
MLTWYSKKLRKVAAILLPTQAFLRQCEQALQFGYTGNGWTYAQKGYALNKLKRHREALAAFDQAFQLGYMDNGWMSFILRLNRLRRS